MMSFSVSCLIWTILYYTKYIHGV